jgi:phosphoribosyl-ATP pyrophosphohydrolase
VDFNQIKKHTECIAQFNGPKKVEEKLIEECVELLHELTREKRNPDKIVEELGDLMIMGMEAMHTLGWSRVRGIIEYKLARQQKRIHLGIKDEIDKMGEQLKLFVADPYKEPSPYDYEEWDYFGE